MFLFFITHSKQCCFRQTKLLIISISKFPGETGSTSPRLTYTCLQITKMENISSENDVIKANLYLVAIIGSFVILTCIAYIFNEGRHICVIPLLRRYRPRCRWVLQQDRLLAENEEKHLVELDLAQHVKHFGMKKSSRAPSATPSYNGAQ